MKKLLIVIFSCLLLFVPHLQAQTAEVTVSLNERFFDALLDAIFTNLKTPSFPIAQKDSRFQIPDSRLRIHDSKSFAANSTVMISRTTNQSGIWNLESGIRRNPVPCDESIRLQREVGGVRTAVRFRDGKIYAPMAFSGSYNPPFVGCVDLQGYAEANIELEFDKDKKTLVGRAKVLNVVLSGTNGIGSNLLTRLVQSSLDKKINPIQILQTDKLSFLIPIQNAQGALRMKATGIRWEIAGGVLNVFIAYEFVKA